jgi:hypothetical protein
MDAMLLRQAPAHPGLLFHISGSNQRGCLRSWLLPQAPARFLHHVPGAEQSVLTIALVATLGVASVTAGWSALYGP